MKVEGKILQTEKENVAWVKRFKRANGVTIAACDLDILGKTLKRNETEVLVNEEFYGGEKVTLNELTFYLNRGDFLNLIGRKVVRIAEKMGLAHEDAKIFLSTKNGEEEVPHVQIYRVSA